MNKRTLLSFAVLILGFALFVGIYSWAWRQPMVDGVPAPFRAVLEWNAKIWQKLHRDEHTVTASPPATGEPRVNSDIGLEEEIDPKAWRLDLLNGNGKEIRISLEDLRKLPRTETTFNFKCIEGWSEVMSFAGVKFSDFLYAYGMSEKMPYVGLETPDGKYYVSIDMASMLNPQTLLAYEMNGKPLAPENGAPLRLAIPVKYGIKNLKRIGKIFLARERPRDYWAEQGYDWFSGL